MKRITGSILTAGTVVAVVGRLGPSAAAATGPSGQSFGQHVANCAQTMGFNGQHNPGIHHGYAGWDGMRCAPAA